ncbi:MAG: hypothetical protein ABIU05_17050 [Nitrospirales bacterium]
MNVWIDGCLFRRFPNRRAGLSAHHVDVLPRLPYMTRLDYFTVGSTLRVLLALITVIVTGYLAAHRQERYARRIDLLARGAFPGAFLLLLLWFMLG